MKTAKTVKLSDVEKIAMEYIEVCKRVKSALQEKETLSASLLLLIPEGSEVKGVKHIKEEKGSVSWKKVSDVIIKELVPKSKADLVEAIIANSTGAPREYIRNVGE
jgi:hypothetical protein